MIGTGNLPVLTSHGTGRFRPGPVIQISPYGCPLLAETVEGKLFSKAYQLGSSSLLAIELESSQRLKSRSADGSTGWYVKRSGDPQPSLQGYRNAVTIRDYECKVRGGQFKCNGKLTPC